MVDQCKTVADKAAPGFIQKMGLAAQLTILALLYEKVFPEIIVYLARAEPNIRR